MSDAKRKRGRPTVIDREAAMAALVETFRAKGFAAASLDDLSEATGLSRPSLYRAFGDKLAMYIGAMNAFADEVGRCAVPALEAPDDLEVALAAFFDAMLAVYYRNPDVAPGCLVFGTAPCSADQDAIQARLWSGVEQLDDLMRARILRSAPHVNAARLQAAVDIASNTLIAMSARAKAGADQAELSAMGSRCARAIILLADISIDEAEEA